MKELINIGVIVGRFQVADLTQGHKELIQYSLDNMDYTIIFIGCTPHNEINKENPLSFIQRKNMILSTFPQNNIFIYVLQDKNNFPVWVQNLDLLCDFYVNKIFPHIQYNLFMIGGRNSFLDGYKNNGGLFETYFFNSSNNGISGTEQRNNIIKNEIYSSDFRKGIIYNIYNNNFKT